MIPASSFLVDGDTALVVCPNEIEQDSDPDWLRLAFWHGAHRPCDTCNGSGEHHYDDAAPRLDGCEDCDGTGRWTFDVRAEQVDRWDGDAITSYRTFRVHVIDVLPIVEAHVTHNDWPRHSFVSANGYHWRYYETEHGDNWHNEGPITLPPDAAPGDWLVRLAVHS